jgi:hypothetical protein
VPAADKTGAVKRRPLLPFWEEVTSMMVHYVAASFHEVLKSIDNLQTRMQAGSNLRSQSILDATHISTLFFLS